MPAAFSYSFTFIACLYLAVLSYDFMWLGLIKILPIGVLLVAVYRYTKGVKRSGLMAALVFSGCGDLLLSFDFFVFGLGAFLVAQVVYGIVFTLNWHSMLTRWPINIGLLVYMSAMIWILWPALNELKLPVLAYIFAIGFMGVAAIQSNYATKLSIVGALTFILSDSLIAVDKFLFTLPYSGIAIMFTYYLAQWLLITSINRHTKLNVANL